ncbi:MAG: hypothetical protein AAF478_14435 [Pseudomonadota bacterium]
MIHYVKFLISALFILSGLWAFLMLSFWKGIAAFLLIAMCGHWLSVLIFKRYASQDEVKTDLQARVESDWDMNH